MDGLWTLLQTTVRTSVERIIILRNWPKLKSNSVLIELTTLPSELPVTEEDNLLSIQDYFSIQFKWDARNNGLTLYGDSKNVSVSFGPLFSSWLGRVDVLTWGRSRMAVWKTKGKSLELFYYKLSKGLAHATIYAHWWALVEVIYYPAK